MNTIPSNICPECGKPMPAGNALGGCPACLIAQALTSHTILPQDEKIEAVAPLSPEEIGKKFPLFEISGCLGRGGMGAVYKARQKSLDRWVAIKILAPERVGQEQFAERFAREAELLAKLSHPHIVTIHDFGETGGLFYIVMEFVDGVNLECSPKAEPEDMRVGGARAQRQLKNEKEATQPGRDHQKAEGGGRNAGRRQERGGSQPSAGG